MVDKYYNIISQAFVQVAINTALEERIDIPSDYRNETLVLLHGVELWPTDSYMVAPETDASYFRGISLNWTAGVGMAQACYSEDVIASFKEVITGALETSVAANLALVRAEYGKQVWKFDKPIPIAQSQLYVVGNTSGQAAVNNFGIKLLFTTVKTKPADWLEVAEARHGYTQ